MFVSRKYLALIHFVAREVRARLHVAEPAHESIECGASASPSRVLLEPLPKCGVQGLVLGLGHEPGLFDQGFVRDASGAVIPGATVVVANDGKGIKRTMTSTDAGVFAAPALLPSSPPHH